MNYLDCLHCLNANSTARILAILAVCLYSIAFFAPFGILHQELLIRDFITLAILEIVFCRMPFTDKFLTKVCIDIVVIIVSDVKMNQVTPLLSIILF